MKGRWRDGLRKFCRDNNVSQRGELGRWASSRVPGIYDDEIVPSKGASRKAAKKETHKKLRQVLKAELRDIKFLADVYWELNSMNWEDSWFECEDVLEELGLRKHHLGNILKGRNYDEELRAMLEADIRASIEDDFDRFDDVRHFAEGTGFDHGLPDDDEEYNIAHGYYRQYDVLDDDDLAVSNF